MKTDKTFTVTPDDDFAADVVIIGGGIAGLYAALHLAPLKVTVITSALIGEGTSSGWAQGGVAAALHKNDSPDYHVADTLAVGVGFCQADAVKLITSSAALDIGYLESFGVSFDRDSSGEKRFSREAAHSQRRVLSIGGDQAGRAIMHSLISAVRQEKRITLIDRAQVLGLGLDREGRVRSLAFQREGVIRVCQSPHIILATGGVGGLYEVTTNPDGSLGQGLAMAYRAGAVLKDIEFIQFHPTALAVGLRPAPLLTEALRGEGARLVDKAGQPLVSADEPGGDLAPRDIVAVAVHKAREEGRGAFLDCRELFSGRLLNHFPQVKAVCEASGIDPAKECLPIAPAAHYHMGGIRTDLEGRSSCEGLWAIGECACTGMHGANRLASNSLLEALVMGRRAALAIKNDRVNRAGSLPIVLPRSPFSESRGKAYHLPSLMSFDVGVIRNEADMTQALAVFSTALEEAVSLADYQPALVCQLLTAAALGRKESRGAHRRDDYPQTLGVHDFGRCWIKGRGEAF